MVTIWTLGKRKLKFAVGLGEERKRKKEKRKRKKDNLLTTLAIGSQTTELVFEAILEEEMAAEALGINSG